MSMALDSSTCIMSSEGLESTDIDSKQAQQESAIASWMYWGHRH